MKKLWAVLAASLLLTACANDSGSVLSSGMNFGGALVKTAVDTQCREELNKRQEWRLAALAMTAEKQREWEDKICGCASEEVPNQLTANDLVQAANASTRPQVIASVTAKTVTACVQRLYK
ncbi:MAG: hypothetical protein Q4D82_00370 [Neisseria sp.]|nr:hypothetical protein [Neisseria sp.]